MENSTIFPIYDTEIQTTALMSPIGWHKLSHDWY